MKRSMLCFYTLLGLTSNNLAASPDISGMHVPENRIYSYRSDPAEHPDFALRHFTMTDRSTRGGLDILAGPFSHFRSNKITRMYGTKNYFSPDESIESFLAEITEGRNEDNGFLGARVGEADRGYSNNSKVNTTTYGRFDQDYHWRMTGDFYDTLGRIYDYQLFVAYDEIGGPHIAQAGYAASMQRQLESDRGLISLFDSMQRGASRQYGVPWGRKLTGIKHFQYQADYDAVKDQGADNIHPDTGEVIKDTYTGSWAEGWRRGVSTYMMEGFHLDMVGQKFSKEEPENIETWPYGGIASPLGKVAQKVNDNLVKKYPSPGAMHTPILFMHDFFAGWKHAQGTGIYERWNGGTPFKDGDHAYLNFWGALFPDHDPYTEINQVLKKQLKPETRTPYGEIVDTLFSDIHPELLSRYDLVVLTTELRSDRAELSDKLKAYVSDGGNLVLFAGHGKELDFITNDLNIQLSNTQTIAANTSLNYQGGEVVNEPRAFELYQMSSLPEGAASIVSTASGSPVMIEVPFGKGTVTLGLTEYGLTDETTLLPNMPYISLNHVKGVLQAKADKVKLFKVSDENIQYITTHDNNGVFTLAVLNQSETPQNFEINPDIGTININSFEEIDLGDPDEMIQDGVYFSSRYNEYDNPLSGEVNTIAAKRALVKTKQAAVYPSDLSKTDIVHAANGDVLPTKIIGGAVRVFRFTLDNSEQLTLLDKEVLSSRPDDWYVNLPMQQVRHRLTRMPNFFFHFGGVKVDAQELLGTSDSIIDYEFGWYRVKHVPFLVDARNITDDVQLSSLIAKIKRLPIATKLALASSPSSEIQALIDNSDITLLTANELVWINQENLPSSSQVADKQIIKVLDLYYPFANEQWQHIYTDLRQLTAKYTDAAINPEQAQLTGQAIRDISQLTTAKHFEKANTPSVYLSLLHIDSLPHWLDENSDLLRSDISGINLDSEYLFGKTIEQLQAEFAWLEARGLSVVVDISSHVRGYKDITYYNFLPTRVEGKARFDNVKEKVVALGLNELIIAPPNNEDWSQYGIPEALEELFTWSESNNISLHLRNAFGSTMQTFTTSAEQSNFHYIQDLYSPLDSLGVYVPVEQAAVESKFLSLKARQYYANQPLANLVTPPNFNNYSNQTFLLDAEYISWDEVATDLEYLGLNTGIPVEVSILASEDTLINAKIDNQNINYGLETTLHVRARDDRKKYSLIKFDVDNNSYGAKLRLFTYDDDFTIEVYPYNGADWDEQSLTWANADHAGIGSTPIATKPAISNNWIEIDVSDYVGAAGSYVFVLKSDKNPIRKLDSREGINPPELVITTAH